MKQAGIKKGAMFISALTMGGIAHGYSYDFTNTLKGPVTLRVKMDGSNEPWYYAVIQGENNRNHQNHTFDFQVNSVGALTQKAAEGREPRTDRAKTAAVKAGTHEWLGRKVGFCLSKKHMEIAPHQFVNGKWQPTTHWVKVTPQLLDVPSFNAMINASSSFAQDATAIAGKKLMDFAVDTAAAATTSVTAGASVFIAKAVGPLLQKAADGVTRFTVGKLVQAIGDIVKGTFCKDRSFKIMQDFDTNGKAVANSYVVIGLAR